MKAYHVICLTLLIAATAAAQEKPMVGKKYTSADDLGMYNYFAAVVADSYLLEAFSTSATKFDARNIHVFLVAIKNGTEERTIVDELVFDRNTGDTFSYVPIYDQRSDTKREYFARFAVNGRQITLKEIYEFDPDSKTIISKQPIPGMRVEIDED